MTKAQLTSALDSLRRHSRPLLVVGLIITALNTVAVVCWLVLYQQHMNPHQVVVSGLVFLAIYLIMCGAWLFAGKSVLRRYAPTCPQCGSLITCTNRNLVLSTGLCPKCGKTLFGKKEEMGRRKWGQIFILDFDWFTFFTQLPF